MNKTPNIPILPSVELIIGTDCVHCPRVLENLSKIVKEGLISELKIMNATIDPQVALKRNVRSVPWARIGEFVLEGVRSYDELKKWVNYAFEGKGAKEYYLTLLENQELDKAIEFTKHDLSRLNALVNLLSDMETPMAARIGISAIFEDLSKIDGLKSILPNLLELLDSKNSMVRVDAVYYLTLLNFEIVKQHLEPLMNDENEEVKEIVREFFENQQKKFIEIKNYEN